MATDPLSEHPSNGRSSFLLTRREQRRLGNDPWARADEASSFHLVVGMSRLTYDAACGTTVPKPKQSELRGKVRGVPKGHWPQDPSCDECVRLARLYRHQMPEGAA